MLEALRCNGPFRQRDLHNEWIWRILAALEAEGVHVTFRFLFAHNKNRGNDLADRTAKSSARPVGGEPPWMTDLVRALRKAVLEADTASPKGSMRQAFNIHELQPLKCHRLFSMFNYDLLFQCRTGSCSLLDLHLFGSSKPCPRCEGHQIGRDKFVDSLKHIFSCPGALPLKVEHFGRILIETANWKDRLASLQNITKPSREDRFEMEALQKKIDTWDFTPKLLWTNIPLAIAFLTRFRKPVNSQLASTPPASNNPHSPQ